MRKGKFILFLSWDIHLFLPLEVRASGSQTFGLRLVFTPSVPLILRPSDMDWIPPPLPDLQLADSRWWDFWASATTWDNSYNKTPFIYNLYISYWFCFSEEAWLIQSLMGLRWGLNKVYYDVAAQYPTCDHWRIGGSKVTSCRAGQGRQKAEDRMKSLRSPLGDRERGSQGLQTARKCSGLSGSVGSIIQHWHQHHRNIFQKWGINQQRREEQISTCLLVCMLSCLVMFGSLQTSGLQPIRFLYPRDSSGKSTGVGCHFLLQGILLIQGSNPHLLWLLHWQEDLYHWATWEVLEFLSFVLFCFFLKFYEAEITLWA